jgi:hypothetical protein
MAEFLRDGQPRRLVCVSVEDLSARRWRGMAGQGLVSVASVGSAQVMQAAPRGGLDGLAGVP